MTLFLALIGVAWVLFIGIIWILLRAGARADDEIERQAERRRRGL